MLRTLLGISTLFMLGNGALTALLVPYVVTGLHARPTAVGVVFSALGAGYLASAYFGRMASDSLRLRRAVAVLLAGAACSFLGFFGWRELPACLAFITVTGLTGGAFLMVRATMVERRAKPGVVGRVSAAFRTAEMAATLVGAALASALVTPLGLTAALNWSIAFVAAAGVLALRLPSVVAPPALLPPAVDSGGQRRGQPKRAARAR